MRRALVPPWRLAGWLERYGASHGGPRVEGGSTGAAVLGGDDGTTATWHLPGVDLGAAVGGGLDLLLQASTAPRTHAVLLLRRGGGVVGVVRSSGGGSDVVSALVRTAYVQGRTKAGGWSQQRYARRRAGQASGLVADVVTAAAQVWGPFRAELARPGSTLVVAGDAVLLARAVEMLPRHLHPVAALPRRTLELREDPRRRSLDRCAPDVGAVVVEVRDADRAR